MGRRGRPDDGLRAGADGSSPENAISRAADSADGTQLQHGRTGTPRYGQELRRPGDLALRCVADGADDRAQYVRPHAGQVQRHGLDLGRGRLRRSG